MRKSRWLRILLRRPGRAAAAAAAAGGTDFTRRCTTWMSRSPSAGAGAGLAGPRVVDLRSDAMSLPGPEMRQAMAQARCGDDLLKEDPVVNGGKYFTL